MQNSDENIYNKKKRIIIFDLDGTISNFKEIDNKIIKKIFGKSKILFFDKLLWKINGLDIFKNTMPLFKLRMFFYCLLTNTRYGEVLKKYKQEYFFYTLQEFSKNYERLLKLNDEFARVIIISNNEYSRGIEKGKIKVKISFSKMYSLKRLKKKYDVAFVVGNNLLDDILTAKLLKLKSIYVGRNRFIKKISNEAMPLDEIFYKYLK